MVADSVIIATGAVARRLPFKGSDEDGGFWNKGISACAVRPLGWALSYWAGFRGRRSAPWALAAGRLAGWALAGPGGPRGSADGGAALGPACTAPCATWLTPSAVPLAQVCDGAAPMFRNQPIAVIGGGDSGAPAGGGWALRLCTQALPASAALERLCLSLLPSCD